MRKTRSFWISVWLLNCLAAATSSAVCADEPRIEFKTTEETVQISVGRQVVAKYVFRDKEIQRPYFTDVSTTSGRQVTRQHPPREGHDSTDHAAMHPGIWVAFGDLGGTDFWRNKGRVVHRRFVQEPKVDGKGGSFRVENEYIADGGANEKERVLCRELAKWSVVSTGPHWWLTYDGEFTASADGVAFGDQEEMGLGVRLATAISVAKGGEIRDADGGKNEKAIWGRQGAWCDYRGTIDDRQVGVAVFPHGKNFRKCWWHVRDYGLMVANPFGQNAFTRGEKSRVELPRDKPLRLRFAVWIHDGPLGETLDAGELYRQLEKEPGVGSQE